MSKENDKFHQSEQDSCGGAAQKMNELGDCGRENATVSGEETTARLLKVISRLESEAAAKQAKHDKTRDLLRKVTERLETAAKDHSHLLRESELLRGQLTTAQKVNDEVEQHLKAAETARCLAECRVAELEQVVFTRAQTEQTRTADIEARLSAALQSADAAERARKTTELELARVAAGAAAHQRLLEELRAENECLQLEKDQLQLQLMSARLRIGQLDDALRTCEEELSASRDAVHYLEANIKQRENIPESTLRDLAEATVHNNTASFAGNAIVQSDLVEVMANMKGMIMDQNNSIEAVMHLLRKVEADQKTDHAHSREQLGDIKDTLIANLELQREANYSMLHQDVGGAGIGVENQAAAVSVRFDDKNGAQPSDPACIAKERRGRSSIWKAPWRAVREKFAKRSTTSCASAVRAVAATAANVSAAVCIANCSSAPIHTICQGTSIQLR